MVAVAATLLVVANMVGTGVFTTTGFLIRDFASPTAGLGSKVGFDATNKWPGESQREWGVPIAMDAAVKRRVDEIWQELGIEPSAKLQDLEEQILLQAPELGLAASSGRWSQLPLRPQSRSLTQGSNHARSNR